jgi:hypothetical protein
MHGTTNIGRHMPANVEIQNFEADRLIRQANDNPDRSEPIYPPDLDPYEATSGRVDLKGDVPEDSVRRLDSLMIEPIMTVADVFADNGWPTPLITDGQRDFYPGTEDRDLQFHGLGLAVDFKTRHLDETQQQELITELRKRLPKAFQLDWRPHGTEIHLHIEYDTPETQALLDIVQLAERAGG